VFKDLCVVGQPREGVSSSSRTPLLVLRSRQESVGTVVGEAPPRRAPHPDGYVASFGSHVRVSTEAG
jgi:hypothetical protein